MLTNKKCNCIHNLLTLKIQCYDKIRQTPPEQKQFLSVQKRSVVVNILAYRSQYIFIEKAKTCATSNTVGLVIE